MLADLKNFLLRGNVVDLAVAVVIGTAFNKIVSSLVADVIMPPIGVLIGGVNFSDLAFTLQEASGSTAAVVLKYGAFLQTVFDFIIIGTTVFVIVQVFEKLTKKEKPADVPAGPTETELLTEIRDLLKK